MAQAYHLRRIERDMPDRADQLGVLRGQKFLSPAMARSLAVIRPRVVQMWGKQGG